MSTSPSQNMPPSYPFVENVFIEQECTPSSLLVCMSEAALTSHTLDRLTQYPFSASSLTCSHVSVPYSMLCCVMP